MSKVSFNQKGYIGASMSNRANLAHKSGEKTISQIRKADADYLTDLITLFAPEYAPVKPLSVGQTKEILRRWGCSSWHHTGAHANKTDFYHPSALFEYTGHPGDFEQDPEAELSVGSIEIFKVRIKTWAEEQAAR